MPTTEPAERTRANAVALRVLGALLAVALVAGAVAYFNRPSQMGPSEDVFRTVDALYTAIRNRDEKRLTECETRLAGYRAAGELPEGAADELQAIIAKARGGSWDTAAERLHAFMSAQTREGAAPAPHPPKKKGK